jgi:hypothetical protein
MGGQAGISRVILIYPESQYRTADSRKTKTDWIAFQILSIEADGSFGKKHNFLPEYEVTNRGLDD